MKSSFLRVLILLTLSAITLAEHEINQFGSNTGYTGHLGSREPLGQIVEEDSNRSKRGELNHGARSHPQGPRGKGMRGGRGGRGRGGFRLRDREDRSFEGGLRGGSAFAFGGGNADFREGDASFKEGDASFKEGGAGFRKGGAGFREGDAGLREVDAGFRGGSTEVRRGSGFSFGGGREGQGLGGYRSGGRGQYRREREY